MNNSGGMIFHTDDLLSKWGFGDGDALEYFFGDDAEISEMLSEIDEHEALTKIVKEFVIPHISQTLTIEVLPTNHNPVRASTVDGVRVDYRAGPNQTIKLTPEKIAVPVSDVIGVINDLYREKRSK